MQTLLDIRLATAKDLAAVDDLFARSYARQLRADYPPSLQVMALPRLARAQPALLRSGQYFLAECEGEIVGAGGWSRDRRLKGLGHVRHLVTDHRRVREGIAASLIRATLAHARKAGMTRMACDATRMAVPFYESQGFVRVAPVEIDLAPGIAFPAMRMARPI